jgi:hypothetical protein
MPRVPEQAEHDKNALRDEVEPRETRPHDFFYDLGSLITDVLGITDNRPFGHGELEQLHAHLNSLGVQISEQGVKNKAQTDAIKGMLGDMRESSERLGRKDWTLVAIGAGTSLVIAGVVPPQIMLQLRTKALHALKPLLAAGGAR